MIKLIVADCDGTILNDHKEIDENLIALLPKLETRNIAFTLASGRNVFLMNSIIESLNLQLPYITNNGANIYVGNELIKAYTIFHGYISNICGHLANAGFAFLVYSEKTVIFHSSHQLLEVFKERLKDKLSIIEYDQSLNLNAVPVFKITVATNDVSEIKDIKELIENECKNISFERSEGNLFTITNSEATKGNAVLAVADYLKIDRKEIMVFGDNYNDLSMFDVASVKVAMGNSDDRIKASSTHETLDNNHNGVSSFICRYFDIK